MKVCKNFIEKPESTTCQNCGCEKWEHDLQKFVNDKEAYRFHEYPICIYGGKGMLEYIKNMPPPLIINIHMGQKAMELFNKALEEEFNKELRKNGFLGLDELFIKTNTEVLNTIEEPTLGFVNTEKLCNSEEVKAFEQIMEAGILKYKKKRNGKK